MPTAYRINSDGSFGGAVEVETLSWLPAGVTDVAPPDSPVADGFVRTFTGLDWRDVPIPEPVEPEPVVPPAPQPVPLIPPSQFLDLMLVAFGGDFARWTTVYSHPAFTFFQAKLLTAQRGVDYGDVDAGLPSLVAGGVITGTEADALLAAWPVA